MKRVQSKEFYSSRTEDVLDRGPRERSYDEGTLRVRRLDRTLLNRNRTTIKDESALGFLSLKDHVIAKTV